MRTDSSVAAKVVPVVAGEFHEAFLRSSDWHQRRQISPQVVTPEMPSRLANPLLGAAHIFNNQRHMSAGRLRCFPLNPEGSFEEGIVRRSQRLRSTPRHRPVAVLLTW